MKKISGGRVLKIEAHALSMLMHLIKKTRVWQNMTMAQIADKISQEYQGVLELQKVVQTLHAPQALQNNQISDFIKTNPDFDQKVAHRIQAAETDARFLSRLAKRHGLQFYVDGDGVHFKERNLTQTPVRSYTWYNGDGHESEWLDFEIENDVTARAGKITKKGFDPLTKKPISHTADNDSAKRSGLAPVVEIVSKFDPETGTFNDQAKTAEEHTEHSTEPTTAGIKSHAQGDYRQTQIHTVKLSFKCVGDPMVLAKRVIEFKGIGKRLSGRYYTKEVTHTIDNSGYIISGKAHTDGHGGYGSNNTKSKAALNKKDPTDQNESVSRFDPETGQFTETYRKKGTEPKG